MIIEDKDIFTDEEKNFVNNIILGKEFNWFYEKQQTTEDSNPFFGHTLITRDGKNVSSHTGFFLHILDKFIKKHSIECKTIYRACINLSFPSRGSPAIHTDFDFPHKQILIYLNEADGNTNIYDNSNNLLKKVSPEAFKTLFFESTPHSGEQPTHGIRVVCVICFN